MKVLVINLLFVSLSVVSCFSNKNAGNSKEASEKYSVAREVQPVGDTTIEPPRSNRSSGREAINPPTSARHRLNQNRINDFRDSYRQRSYTGNRTIKQMIDGDSRNIKSSYNLMGFGQNIGALLSMYQATDSIAYLEEAVLFVDQVIGRTQTGKEIANNPKDFKDDYLGWVNDGVRSGGKLQEVPLFESRFLRYVAKMMYLVFSSPEIKSNHSEIISRSEGILHFLEKNGWEKWYFRGENRAPGCYPFLFRNRTHMGSHWAIVALYLKELTTDSDKLKQYNDFLAQYDKQLRDNFRLNENDAYIWNMTWDSAWPFDAKCYGAAEKSIIQDVDHGNHVVAYIVEAYDLGKGKGEWTREDIDRLCNTVKYILYDKDKKRFYADLNKQFKTDFADGVRMSDGFISLARYDDNLFQIVEIVKEEQYTGKRFRFVEPQYYAELLLAERYHIFQ